MLKTIGSSDDLAPKAFRADGDKVIGSDGRANETVVDLSKSKKSKNEKSKHLTRIGAMEKPTFLTPGAKEAFNCLKQAFIEAPILQHFDPECHIQIETDVLGYAIGGVLSQLSTDWIDPNGPKNLTKSDFG